MSDTAAKPFPSDIEISRATKLKPITEIAQKLGIDADDIRSRLAGLRERINVSCSTETSTMLDMRARGLKAVVRASVHAYNAQEDIDALVYALNEIQLRR